jgi:hypothetical protein
MTYRDDRDAPLALSGDRSNSCARGAIVLVILFTGGIASLASVIIADVPA